MHSFRLFLVLILALVLAGCNIPPTATLVPATLTPVPPTATATPVPATVTPLPPIEPVIGWVPLDFRMFNANEGWGQADGNLLRTEDGGSHWQVLQLPELPGSGGYALGYLNSQALWVMVNGLESPDQGRMLRTLDGGVTWQTFDVPFGAGMVQVLNEQQLFAMAGYGAGAGSEAVALWGSQDGGATWALLADARPDNEIPDTISFGGSKDGVAAADGQRLFITGYIPTNNYSFVFASTDGGTTWAHQELTITPELADGENTFHLPRFFDPQHGVMFARMYSSDYSPRTGVYATQDGGITWSFQGTAAQPGVSAVADMQHLFVWDGTTFSASLDGGQTWQVIPQTTSPGSSPMSMYFIDAQTGWIVDYNDGAYQIYRTTNGGQTWVLLAEAAG